MGGDLTISAQKIIGVAGGMGPYAGLELVKSIFDETVANSDAEHLSVILISFPSEIEDRSLFLLEKTARNPAWAILDIITKLEGA